MLLDFRSFIKKKTIPKGLPTVIQNRMKTTIGPYRYYRFWPLSEKVFFGCPRNYPKQLKIDQNAPKGRFCRFAGSPGVPFWARRSQGPPRARVLVNKKTTEGQLVEDLTRQGPLARRTLLIITIITVGGRRYHFNGHVLFSSITFWICPLMRYRNVGRCAPLV